jgi:hypothetical protein
MSLVRFGSSVDGDDGDFAKNQRDRPRRRRWASACVALLFFFW